MADTLTKEQRSYCMSQIKAKDTKIEIELRKKLFNEGLRYRIHYKKLPGKPDIAFVNKKIAIFVDGDFWHGRDFNKRKKTYNHYWLNKIKRNIERDKEVDKKIKKLGWKVIRIWGKDLQKNQDKVFNRVLKRIKK